MNDEHKMTALKTALIALLTGLAIVATLATLAQFGGETSELTEVPGRSERSAP